MIAYILHTILVPLLRFRKKVLFRETGFGAAWAFGAISEGKEEERGEDFGQIEYPLHGSKVAPLHRAGIDLQLGGGGQSEPKGDICLFGRPVVSCVPLIAPGHLPVPFGLLNVLFGAFASAGNDFKIC